MLQYRNKGWKSSRCCMSPKEPMHSLYAYWKISENTSDISYFYLWGQLRISITSSFPLFLPWFLHLFSPSLHAPHAPVSHKQKHTPIHMDATKPPPTCDFFSQSFVMALINNWSRGIFWLFKEPKKCAEATIFTFSEDPRQEEPPVTQRLHSHRRRHEPHPTIT